MFQVFNDDDNEYLKWMETHPSHFIVNTGRAKNYNLFVLHKAKCTHIASVAGLAKGAYTERNYIKVVSDDLNELKVWFIENNNKFTGEFVECKTCNPFSEKSIESAVYLFPEIVEEDDSPFVEGAQKQVVVNGYERNFQARKKCIQHYGYRCAVCSMDFEKVYGIIGKDFIHVHHLKQISNIKKSYTIDPITDLRPVCPNCHAMLHQRKNPCYSIEELQLIIAENNQLKTYEVLKTS